MKQLHYTFWITILLFVAKTDLQAQNFLPEGIQVELQNTSTPFNVEAKDLVGAPYVPNQIVILYEPGTTEQEKALIREEAQVSNTFFSDCKCRDIEIWNYQEGVNIEERITDAEGRPKIKEAGYNYHVHDYNNAANFSSSDMDLTGVPEYVINNTSDENIIVALLDTGVDYEHDVLKDYLWYNAEEDLEGGDNDENCLVDDLIGWNFFDETNNPWDNHGHGTHVAGILASHLDACGDVKIMNLKTHDQFGLSTLYTVTCATYYAIDKGAKVINMSWGFYSESDTSILFHAIEDFGTMNNGIAIASSGNSGYNTDNPMFRHYPSCYNLGNIVSVAAIDSTNVLWPGSNYGQNTVDLAAYGKNIHSTYPINTFSIKTGTSMSAPFVSARAALEYNNGIVTFADVRNTLYADITPLPSLNLKTTTGGKLNNNFASAHLTILLQGYFDAGQMHNNLPLSTYFPFVEPYTNLGYTHVKGGGETLNPNADLTQLTDWVFLELRPACNPQKVAATRSVLVKRNGQVVTTSNEDQIEFKIPKGNYYLVVRHRNHLDLVTATPVFLDEMSGLYDFTDLANPIAKGGVQAAKTINNQLWMFSGDVDNQQDINNIDFMKINLNQGTAGYKSEDLNGDVIVDGQDIDLYWKKNVGKGSYTKD